MIILGDAGINFYLGSDDYDLKRELKMYKITFFCVHGNHEERPYNTECNYKEKIWHGGTVYVEDKYPNIIFAKDGEVYDFNGKKALVIGGAYSVDKYVRLQYGERWFESEQPDEEIKKYVEAKLEQHNWKVDIVLSHTVPINFIPQEALITSVDPDTVDKSTEIWLQKIYDKLEFEKWYAGHFHTEKEDGKIKIMYEDYEEI